MADATCAVEGCQKRAKSRGWCPAHYERWRRNGDPGPAGDGRRKLRVPCRFGGCTRTAVVDGATEGYCREHIRKIRAYGSPLGKRPTYGSGRSMHADGYVRVWEPEHPIADASGYVMEHRKVMFDAGLLNDSAMHVHHRNGDKTDNRLMNLEVLSASEHTRLHVHEAGEVTNQFGTWPLRNAG